MIKIVWPNFVANYAKIDRPQDIGGQQELSFRFVEGARAAGTVMLGKPVLGMKPLLEHFPMGLMR